MNSHDEYYELKESVRNLMMLKMAYDKGLKIANLPEYVTNYGFNQEKDWDIFFGVLNSFFTIVESWSPYSDDDEESEKAYWLSEAYNSAMDKDEIKTKGVMVVLDDLVELAKIPIGGFGGGSDFYQGWFEINAYDKGALVTWDEEDGVMDLVDLLFGLLQMIPDIKEREHNAMAI